MEQNAYFLLRLRNRMLSLQHFLFTLKLNACEMRIAVTNHCEGKSFMAPSLVCSLTKKYLPGLPTLVLIGRNGKMTNFFDLKAYPSWRGRTLRVRRKVEPAQLALLILFWEVNKPMFSIWHSGHLVPIKWANDNR